MMEDIIQNQDLQPPDLQPPDLQPPDLRAQDLRTQILCVNDFQDNCDLFCFVLSEAGYATQTASSIRKGIQKAQNSRFALYLIDLSLPDGSGLDLAKKIREFDRSTPIVVSSGDGRPAIRTDAMQLGVQAFLTLPIDINVLTRTIRELLSDALQIES